MNKQNILLGAAIVGLMTAGTTLGHNAQAKDAVKKCAGGNACKGNSACKTAKNSCKGQNACKGQGFVMATKAECAKMKADAAKPADAEKKDDKAS